MARSLPSTPLAFPAEIARYLCAERADIELMMEMDALPHLRIPKPTRTVKRIPLRDFHTWLKARARGETPALADYETFLKDFDASRSAQS